MSGSAMTKRDSIRLTDEQRAQIDALAGETGLTKTNTIRALIDIGLEQKEQLVTRQHLGVNEAERAVEAGVRYRRNKRIEKKPWRLQSVPPGSILDADGNLLVPFEG